ncbi:hypothetical protein ACFT30_14140 [Microbacterium ureisolvens]|uniref:hypothetical protein n=1 Tax=Microbacterium ureisolvens TaxID=2781186 RepID=UPI00363D1CC5
MTDDHDSATATQTSGISRRALLRTGAWAAPVIMVAAAAPAASASVTNPQLSGSFSIYSNGLQGNAFAQFESGTWEPDNLVQITIASTAPVLGNPDQTQLNGWIIVTQSPTSVTLQYPSPPTGNFWTTPYLNWFAFDGAAPVGSVTVNGLITGTTANGFSGGPITGPAQVLEGP